MKRFEILSEITLALIYSDNFYMQINSILKKIGEYSNVSRARVIIESKDETMKPNVFEWCSVGIKSKSREIQSEISKIIPVWKKILENVRYLRTENKNEFPLEIAPYLESLEIISLLVFPIYADSKFIGFLSLEECRAYREWEQSEIILLKKISEIISAMYKQQMIRNQLNEEKNNLKILLNSIEDLILIGDNNGNIIYENQTVTSKLGYLSDELRQMSILDLYPEEKKETISQILNSVSLGENFCLPIELAGKDKKKIPVESRIWQGKWIGQDCIFSLHKDLRQEEENLQKFTKLFENNPVLMAISSIPDLKFVDANNSFFKKLGFKKEEILGKTVEELGLFLDPEKQVSIVETLKETGHVQDIEIRVRCKNDSVLYGLFSGEVIQNQGKKFVLTVMVDITEQVLLARIVKDQKERMENTIQGARLGTWEWNIKTGEVILNDRSAEILGYTLADLKPIRIETWEKFIHSEDLIRAKKSLQEHFKKQKEYYEFEVRMKHKSGNWVWVLNRGKVIEWDNIGLPLKMFGTHADITERKSIEVALKESEKRFQLAVDGAEEGIWDVNLITGSVYHSPRMREMLGYTQEELPEKNEYWEAITHPDDLPIIQKQIKDHLESTNNEFRSLLRLSHHDGTWHWIQSRGKIIRDSNGKAIRIIGTHMDVTEIKQADDAREEALTRLQKLASRLPGVAYQFRQNIDGTSCFPFASEAIKQIYRVNSNEVKHDASKVFQVIHPEDYNEVIASIQKSAYDLSPWQQEYRVKFDDGTIRWLFGNAIPERENEGSTLWHGFITDITDKKQAENALKESEARFRKFFEKNSSVMLLVEPSAGAIIDANESAVVYYGYTLEEITHMSINGLSISPTELVSTEIKSALLEEGNYLISEHRLASGEIRDVEVYITPIETDGRTLLIFIIHDITERKIAEEKLKEISISDSLTNIFNRRYIFQRLEEVLSEYLRNHNPFSVLIIDLDHFKNINDLYGHQAGDFILVEFAKILKSHMRPYDLLGRYGGEEFIIVFINAKKEQFINKVEFLLDIVRHKIFKYKESEIMFSFSCGISDSSEFDSRTISVEKIIETADNRLYKAKKTGRNKLVID
jgi:diguanylate cyclase (GGDEF)-like protein/PAS domain S-box-containing protein